MSPRGPRLSMLELTQGTLRGYELIDSGEGRRLERFGDRILDRPDAACLWRRGCPDRWRDADLRFAGEEGRAAWRSSRPLPDSWEAAIAAAPGIDLALELRATVSKNVGLFPEQAPQWAWMAERIAASPAPVSVLNLFAYTGAATLALAAAGATVRHIDASRSAVAWARANAARSGLADRPIHWIAEDALRFLEREAKRGRRHEALLLDPPAFGRDPRGRPFKFLDAIPDLLAACRAALAPAPRFVVLNGYATGLSAVVLAHLLADAFPGLPVEWGELHLAESSPRARALPCSAFARIGTV